MKLVERFKVSSDEVIHISVFSDKTIVRRDHMKSETYTGLSEALQAVKTRYVQLPEELSFKRNRYAEIVSYERYGKHEETGS